VLILGWKGPVIRKISPARFQADREEGEKLLTEF